MNEHFDSHNHGTKSGAGYGPPAEFTNAWQGVPEVFMSKVFGVGWAKTGTTTLGKCLQILGYDHQGQNLDLVKDIAKHDLSRIMSLAREKDSFEDWPWIILYKELDEAFPGSRFVLTTRDSRKWIASYRNMLRNEKHADDHGNELRRILYGLPFPDVSDEQLIERYDRHNREVIHYFRDRREALLVVDWEQGHGWRELCGFVGKDVPDEAFPHANKGRYARGSVTTRIRELARSWWQ